MDFSELPGAEFILPGLDDLHKGENTTIGALLIANTFGAAKLPPQPA